MERSAVALFLPLAVGSAACQIGDCEADDCGGVVDILHACSGGRGCDVDAQPVECSPKTAIPNQAVGDCQVESVGTGQSLTIDLSGIDLERRDDIRIGHGTGLALSEFQGSLDFRDAQVEFDGMPAACAVENTQVTCANVPAGVKSLRITNPKRSMRFVTVTSSDAECRRTAKACAV